MSDSNDTVASDGAVPVFDSRSFVRKLNLRLD